MTFLIATVVCTWWIAHVHFGAAYAIPATTPPRDGHVEGRLHIFPDPGNSPGEPNVISESTITDIVVVLALALLLAGGIIWFIKKRPYKSNNPSKQQMRIDLPTTIGRPPTPLVTYPPVVHVTAKKHGGATSAYPTASTT